MDQPLQAPRNRTAELQLIVRLVSQGYTLWTADQIPLGKLSGFLAKWAHYRLLANPAARAYRKKMGRANTHLVLEHRFNPQEAQTAPHTVINWLMLGTPGREGLGDSTALPGTCQQRRASEISTFSGWGTNSFASPSTTPLAMVSCAGR